ncbi:hypothetical protein [Polaromonas sp.]|uniref:hypothetical protein n=1 Tax=Polaromonas sp. TaxID=1869339 RepID=UPI0013B7B998|nr:hypothetical protein [Polaromonas sp.]NDP61500.1 hypothetical protein [Polaromonas sp.]
MRYATAMNSTPTLNGRAAAAPDVDDPYGFKNLLRGDDPIMRGHEKVPASSVAVQLVQVDEARPQTPQNGFGAESAIVLMFGTGFLLLAVLGGATEKRSMFGRFARPVLFAGLFLALLLGAGLLSNIKDSASDWGLRPAETGLVIGLLYGTFIALLGFLARKIWRLGGVNATHKHDPVAQPPTASARMPEKTEDSIYATIDIELESGNMNRGLWTRLYADCDGNDAKTRAAYIRARAVQLQRSV